ncbi:uncharacterized protein [Littorina saxatilis]|uniref:Uncharacterized protein n=1 Tax=Littorina saxatilis TaxID=31220 RepID=A0AAN9G798_9CAEN
MTTTNGRTTTSLLRQGSRETEREESREEEEEEEEEESVEEEEVRLEGEELFMTLTPEEEAAWRSMVEQRQTTLTTQKEEFSNWKDGFTRRRMFAYSRIRRLQNNFRQRDGFYGNLAEYIAALEAKVKAKKKVKFQDSEGAVNGQINNGQNNGQTENSGTSDTSQQQGQQLQGGKEAGEKQDTLAVIELVPAAQ